jgi:hypothetical protein
VDKVADRIYLLEGGGEVLFAASGEDIQILDVRLED